tara:strand:+ start:99 stop:347 length:249 start_codon:yes stop_codon:yes gene_type:complete
MAEIILYPGNEINSKTIFEAPTNIKIDSIKNKYILDLNFKEDDAINVGETIYIKNSISIDNLEIINGIRQNDGSVIVQYTEI